MSDPKFQSNLFMTGVFSSFFHLLLHWIRQPFLGIPPFFISDPGYLCLFLYLDLLWILVLFICLQSTFLRSLFSCVKGIYMYMKSWLQGILLALRPTPRIPLRAFLLKISQGNGVNINIIMHVRATQFNIMIEKKWQFNFL